MRVGFYLTDGGDGTGYVLAESLVRSIRTTMPSVAIVQLTDLTSPAVKSADAVLRLPTAPLSLHRSALYTAAGEGNWLFLDTDVIVRRDVSDVFAHPFEIAVVDREWHHMPPTYKFTQWNPYNAGVVFSRTPAFWHAVHATITRWAHKLPMWTADQIMLGKFARSGRYRVRILPGMTFNYPPTSAHDPGMQDAAIVHYKGGRKIWLLDPPAEGAA